MRIRAASRNASVTTIPLDCFAMVCLLAVDVCKERAKVELSDYTTNDRQNIDIGKVGISKNCSQTNASCRFIQRTHSPPKIGDEHKFSRLVVVVSSFKFFASTKKKHKKNQNNCGCLLFGLEIEQKLPSL